MSRSRGKRRRHQTAAVVVAVQRYTYRGDPFIRPYGVKGSAAPCTGHPAIFSVEDSLGIPCQAISTTLLKGDRPYIRGLSRDHYLLLPSTLHPHQLGREEE